MISVFNNYGVTVVGLMVQTLNAVSTSATSPTNPSSPLQGFIQDLFLGGGGDVDACKGCMRVSVLLNEILDIFKDKKHQIQL